MTLILIYSVMLAVLLACLVQGFMLLQVGLLYVWLRVRAQWPCSSAAKDGQSTLANQRDALAKEDDATYADTVAADGSSPPRYRLAILVPAFNEASLIEDNLRLLAAHAADKGSIQLIVAVDKGSADGTHG